MKRFQIAVLLSFICFPPAMVAQDNRLLNLYDAFGEETGQAILDWGFSALVEYNGKLILFDGGASADILQHNAKALGVDLAKVDIAVLSHSHVDHTSGLDYLLKINPKVKLYLPNDPTIGGWPTDDAEEAERNKKYQRGYRFRDANVTYVKENMQIAPEIALIATTSSVLGEFSKYPPHDKEPSFEGLPEVSLALQTRNGEWVLVVGCSHSQVENIIRETKQYCGKNVAGVAGGFHLLPYALAHISDIAEMLKDELQVKWVAPAHCTGKTAHEVFKALYKENCRPFGLGSRVTF